MGDQSLERLPDLVPARVAVDVMHLVQVDAVGLQPAQRRLAVADDVASGDTPGAGFVAHRAIDLGGKHDSVSPARVRGEPATEDLLGPPLVVPPVDVGGVGEVHSGVEGGVEDRVGGVFGRYGTEVHGAETELADQNAGPAEVGVLHLASLVGGDRPGQAQRGKPDADFGVTRNFFQIDS